MDKIKKLVYPTKRFEKYYDMVIYNYLLYGIFAYIGKAILSVLLSKYIHWTLGLIITLIITVLEFFSIRMMRAKIPEAAVMHSLLNLIPGMKYVHIYAVDKIE